MRSLRLMLLATLALVVAADFCLWSAPSGWCWSALLAGLTAAVVWRFRPVLRQASGGWMLALVLGAEVAMFLEPGWLAGGLALLGLSALAQMARPAPLVSPFVWLRGLLLGLPADFKPEEAGPYLWDLGGVWNTKPHDRRLREDY